MVCLSRTQSRYAIQYYVFVSLGRESAALIMSGVSGSDSETRLYVSPPRWRAPRGLRKPQPIRTWAESPWSLQIWRYMTQTRRVRQIEFKKMTIARKNADAPSGLMTLEYGNPQRSGLIQCSTTDSINVQPEHAAEDDIASRHGFSVGWNNACAI